MGAVDVTFKFGGEAGQGVETTGRAFARSVVRAGLHVFGYQDYHSRIRGGHNYYQIRVSDREVHSHNEQVHVLLPFTQVTVNEHLREVVPGGAVVLDPALGIDEKQIAATGARPMPVPLQQIALNEGGDVVMANTAATGAAAGLVGLDLEVVSGVVRDSFGKKGGPVVEKNLKVAAAAYGFARDTYARDFAFKLTGRQSSPRMMISGNDALAMGALVGGVKFVAGYPMTPGSPILEWLAAHSAEYGLVTKHAEDEIAAVNMIIGAAQMGARSLTTTSGGGFCLMVEALGLAGMTEVPVVVIDVQRPGPATGHATRHEQGDLLFLIHAAQGEFPRIVLAPGTVEQCFEAGYRALNLAERFQCPVLILSDAFLAHSPRDLPLEAFDLNVPIDRGDLLTEEQLDTLQAPYLRHAVTESGVSPRALQGHPKAVYPISSDEHEADGHICEDAAARIEQMSKRMRKLETARGEMSAPIEYGPREAELTFVTWGSTVGPLRSVLELLQAEGKTARIVQIVDIWPLPVDKVEQALQGAKKLVVVEQNYGGQLATLLRAYTDVRPAALINRYDGRPMTPEYILRRLQEVA